MGVTAHHKNGYKALAADVLVTRADACKAHVRTWRAIEPRWRRGGTFFSVSEKFLLKTWKLKGRFGGTGKRFRVKRPKGSS
ncbi:hypothetical protein RHMOL_Rhmol10G0208600 [Rhododendron molle]|uniref:Uncharacterized protein n=1 Tax=Rhododendron molle TaxID=49168 RepID=A0ACC0M5M2_RHOML|nr:hypothetical protein RHMOL_Rhmol10G0208600 [Rhododendron molle]